tara:strand:+ start:1217 stop:2272 length:1056 start_codon:yes stop_codon:yes gene_type:complete
MRTLKRPMFRKGGSANSGIMDGLDRKGYDNGGRIEPFNALTADTYGSPYYDNEAVMENLRRFQKLGMGNPYRELGGKAGFDSIGDYIFRPAEKDLFKSIYEAAPIAKEKKAAKEAIKREVELRPYKKYFSSDEGVNYKAEVPEVPKDTGNISDINVKDVQETLSDKRKKYMEMMAPGMQKRMIYDSLAAASEAFGKGTGNTRQTIANAITAAAKGMGGAKDLADKISLLTVQGEIQKDIEKSKTVKKSNYEYLYDKMTSPDPKDQDFARSILKQDKDLGDFVEQHGTDKGYRLFVGKNFPDIKDTFSGDETSLKKLKTEELEDGKYYLGPPADEFIIIQGGKITKREPGLV